MSTTEGEREGKTRHPPSTHLCELFALCLQRFLGREHAIDSPQTDVLGRLAVDFFREQLYSHASTRVQARGGDDLRDLKEATEV